MTPVDSPAVAEALETNLLAATIGPLSESAGPPRRAMDRLLEMGVRGVQWSANHAGMRPRELDHSARRDLLATVRRRAMTLTGIDLWIPTSHFDDDGHSERAIEALVQAVTLAEELGRLPVSTALPAPASDGAAKRMSPVHAMIADVAQRRGVAVADHAPKRVETAGIGVGVDPAALLSTGIDVAQRVIEAGGDLVSARLCDLQTSGNRGPIGERDGQLDVISYRAALAAVEHRGALIIDTRSWREPWPGIEQTMSAWRRAAPFGP